jgi:hypothetical protein
VSSVLHKPDRRNEKRKCNLEHRTTWAIIRHKD